MTSPLIVQVQAAMLMMYIHSSHLAGVNWDFFHFRKMTRAIQTIIFSFSPTLFLHFPEIRVQHPPERLMEKKSPRNWWRRRTSRTRMGIHPEQPRYRSVASIHQTPLPVIPLLPTRMWYVSTGNMFKTTEFSIWCWWSGEQLRGWGTRREQECAFLEQTAFCCSVRFCFHGCQQFITIYLNSLNCIPFF